MPKPPSFGRLLTLIVVIAAAGPSASTTLQDSPGALKKIDKPLHGRALKAQGRSRVIVRGVDGASSTDIADAIRGAGGASGKALKLIRGRVADLPDGALLALANHPSIAQVSEDRAIVGAMERTGTTVGATAVRQDLGYDGSGIGVAVIDSGVAAHDDLAGANGAPRIDRFVDFVAGQDDAYDDYGHGTHIAGIIAGNGFDSGGARSGIAPGARLIVLKVLDGYGNGYISDVIDALDYVATNKDELNIRVVNLSIATGVYESYETDPLTVAAEQVVKQGVVVVAAAGNSGRGPDGTDTTWRRYRAWKCSLGVDRRRVQPHGDRRPRRRHHRIVQFTRSERRRPMAKPDLVAPGIGIESLSDPGSTLYLDQVRNTAVGTVPTAYRPYLEPEWDEHGGPGRDRSGRPDVAGQPGADAQCCEGDHAVHGGGPGGTIR